MNKNLNVTYIDDTSKILPSGKRRSEEWIKAHEEKEQEKRELLVAEYGKQERETSKRQRGYSDEYFGNNSNYEIPYNQNRAGSFKNYIWQIPLGIIIFFLLGIYIITHF